MARRNTMTQKLDVMRGPTTAGFASFDQLDNAPAAIDSTFCGPAEVETAPNTATWWRDQNNFVEVQMLPSGRIAVAHVTCADNRPGRGSRSTAS